MVGGVGDVGGDFSQTQKWTKFGQFIIRKII